VNNDRLFCAEIEKIQKFGSSSFDDSFLLMYYTVLVYRMVYAHLSKESQAF